MNIVLDIGGTKTRVGLVSDAYNLLETSILLTSKNFSKGIKDIFEFIKGKDIRVNGICLGLPGELDNKREKLFFAPNLKGWIGKPIGEVFMQEFAAKVFIENDAALAGLGEAVYGAGKDYKIVSYITISTGVGGARIVNKNIDEKVYGFEPGHHIVCSDRITSSCCSSSTACEKSFETFEDIASGKSIRRIWGKSPRVINDKKIWGEIIKNVAVGISNSICFWSPELVVLGGGVALSDYFDITILKKEVVRIIRKTYPAAPEIKKAQLGDFAGLWGGIAYLARNI
jgi:glucokinase